jgi:tetratricopeptide (TPR) repeat protein
LVVIGGGIAVVCVALIVLWEQRHVRAAYHGYRSARHLDAARTAAAGGDWTNAALLARSALQHRRDVEGFRMLAQALKATGEPQYLVALGSGVELDPGNAGLAGEFVEAAAQIGARDYAFDRVMTLANRFTNDARVQFAAGRFFVRAGARDAALVAFDRAVALRPDDLLAVFSRARARMRSADPVLRRQGREVLEGLRRVPDAAEAATFALAQELQDSEPNGALMLWDELAGRSPTNWVYQLGREDARVRARYPGWEGSLDALARAATNLAQQCDAGMRLARHRGPAAVEAWLASVPAADRGRFAVRAVLVEARETAGDHRAVVELVDEAVKEGDLNGAARTRLWLAAARARKALGDDEVAVLNLRNAAQAAGSEPDLCLDVAAALDEAGDAAQSVDLYLRAARGAGTVRMRAVSALNRMAARSGDPKRMLEIFSRLASQDPDDTASANNVAALLLQDDRTIARGLEQARRVHERSPGNPMVADTYAWAQLLAGQPQRALEMYEAMPPEARDVAEVRVHFAEALRRVGRTNEIPALVDRLTGETLLPREQALLLEMQGRAQ